MKGCLHSAFRSRLKQVRDFIGGTVITLIVWKSVAIAVAYCL